MKKREIVYHLKQRWEAVHKAEVENQKKTSLKDRFNQTIGIFDLAEYLKFPFQRNNSEIHDIRERWRRLKNYYHETK